MAGKVVEQLSLFFFLIDTFFFLRLLSFWFVHLGFIFCFIIVLQNKLRAVVVGPYFMIENQSDEYLEGGGGELRQNEWITPHFEVRPPWRSDT